MNVSRKRMDPSFFLATTNTAAYALQLSDRYTLVVDLVFYRLALAIVALGSEEILIPSQKL